MTEKKAGRPFCFDSPEEMKQAIDMYFAACRPMKSSGPPPTLSGLAYELGVDRRTIYNYSKRDKFADIVNRAKSRVEMYLEQRLDEGAVAGTIFNLKNNYGWVDAQQVDKTETRTTRIITNDDSKL